jgi:hypothetical protein
VDPTCIGDPEVSVHTCAPEHQINVHGGAGEGVKGVYYVRSCQLYNCTFVHDYVMDRHTLVHACVGNRCT